jgi:hypothetical protein
LTAGLQCDSGGTDGQVVVTHLFVLVPCEGHFEGGEVITRRFAAVMNVPDEHAALGRDVLA